MKPAEKVRHFAGEMGFEAVGITGMAALAEGEKALERWVAEGRHGTMRYLEQFTERRSRFFADFPDAKSIVVLGVSYYRPSSGAAPGALMGKVARYAWGRDYHQVIRQKHQELIGRLSGALGPEFKAKSCVDIEPVPERFAAARAGLGFIGKHTGLLDRRFGSWLFLSELVTNLDLPEDAPGQGHCGTCAKCQHACPTGALDRDYQMDARRCIAYLTIEHKGVIPREMRPHIKDWVFGCDACLEVCPVGSGPKESRWPEFHPQAGAGEWIALSELFELASNRAYEKRFAGTALLRAGRKQMLRNACLVLGNSRDPGALPSLGKALGYPDPLVRLHAAWALGCFESDPARKMLEDRLAAEQDGEVRTEILDALHSAGNADNRGKEVPPASSEVFSKPHHRA